MTQSNAVAPKRWSRKKVITVVILAFVVIGIVKSAVGSSGGSSGSSSSGGSSQTVSHPYTQSDWNDVCAGGGCNPNDGLPNYVPGGGLAITNP